VQKKGIDTGLETLLQLDGEVFPWDHKHHESVISPYEFENPYQLLEDFWNDVNKIINSGD